MSTDEVFERISAIDDALVEARREVERANQLSLWETQELYDMYHDIEMTEEALTRFKRNLFYEVAHREDDTLA